MLNNIKKTAFYFTKYSIVIDYEINTRSSSLEIAKNGECDLNDLDEFCFEFLPGYTIGAIPANQMNRLARKIYSEYKKEVSLQTAISMKIQKLFTPHQRFINNTFHPSHQKLQLCLQ